MASSGSADLDRFWEPEERVTPGPVVTDMNIRCMCNKLLAEMASRPWRIRCPRCKAVVESSPRMEG